MRSLLLYLIILICVFYSCSSDNTVTPQGDIVVIDRTGITDSMYTNFPPFVYSYITNMNSLHITFSVKGDSNAPDNIFYLSQQNPAYSLIFVHLGQITSNYQQFDSTVAINQITDSIYARAYPLNNPTWIAVKDFKVVGN